MESIDQRVQRLPSLGEPELGQLQALVAASHWNQLPEDWALFFEHGRIGVVRDEQGRIVASGAVLPLPPATAGAARVSWISMVLVAPALRGAGLGRAVFADCLREVMASGAVPMLDATEQGEGLYRQHGFEALWRFARWRREAVAPALRASLVGEGRSSFGAAAAFGAGAAAAAGGTAGAGADARDTSLRDGSRNDSLRNGSCNTPLRESAEHAAQQRETQKHATTLHRDAAPAAVALERLLAFDQQALGLDRRALLGGLAAREGARCVGLGGAVALVRPGRRADQIGPVYAQDEAEGARLLQSIAAASTGELVIDVPQNRPAMEAALRAAGFTPERAFARMAPAASQGALPPARTESLLAVAGPEFA